mmetsp:Transcript_72918/g.169035  ORF Transcript_72918/g.169035 Transcript_72918/m.169035 type:complete len:167 (+) Transcript_72918:1185-1685(+)
MVAAALCAPVWATFEKGSSHTPPVESAPFIFSQNAHERLHPRPTFGIFWCGYRDAAKWVCTEPRAAFDQCKCRRSARREQADGTSSPAEGPTDDHLRWHAVRALLSCEGQAGLPEVDPATGESVASLIEDMTSLADRESRAASRVLTVLLVVAVPLLLATIPALYE